MYSPLQLVPLGLQFNSLSFSHISLVLLITRQGCTLNVFGLLSMLCLPVITLTYVNGTHKPLLLHVSWSLVSSDL